MGGIETTALHLLRRMDPAEFRTDFAYVEPERPSVYDGQLRDLGARVLACSKRRYWAFQRNFPALLREYGPYDVVHCHTELSSGMILRLARKAGVPVRVSHSHNDYSRRFRERSRLLVAWNRRLLRRHATLMLAISRKAAATYYGEGWDCDPRVHVLLQGRDFSDYATPVDRAEARAELGLPQDALVVGHIGRFHPQKNHSFLVDIFSEVAKREKKARLLLVGDGKDRPLVERRLKEMDLLHRAVLAGTRFDVPRVLRGAVDVFLLPSLFEGLGLVLVEAQAAGLPCVFSDITAEEVDVVLPLIHRMGLDRSASEWAGAVLSAAHAPRPSASEALEIVLKSGFNVSVQAQRLGQFYRQGLMGRKAGAE